MVRGWRCTVAAVCVSALLAVGACGTSISVTTRGQAEGPVLKIGVAADQPSMGWVHNDTYQGFEIDVASYVGRVLGYGSSQIEYVTTTPSSAPTQVDDGTVQMAVTTLPMDETHSDQVAFAGPYLTVRDGLMVRADAHEPSSLNDLAGHSVCVVEGSGTQELLEQAISSVTVRTRADYGECVSSLMTDESDAVAGGEPVLYGLVKQTGTQYVRMIADTFGSQQYGIAVKRNQPTLVEQINDALKQMISDGSWAAAAATMQSFSGYRSGEQLTPPTLS